MTTLEVGHVGLRRWRWQAAALPGAITLYCLAAFAVSPDIYQSMLVDYVRQTELLPAVLAVGLSIGALFNRPRAPLSFIVEIVRARFFGLCATVFWLCLGLAAFTTLKLAIPRLVPFYADPMLAGLDGFLHHGDPGAMLHALVPAWAVYPLAWLYGLPWFVAWFGFIGFVALQSDGALRSRYMWSMALVVGLIGTVLACLFASVGPVFYDQIHGGTRFAEMDHFIATSSIARFMQMEMAYLYSAYAGDGIAMGTGISAMPSMHVAIVVLNAWMLTKIDRRIGIVAWLYVAVIMFDSVLLGWHYAVDGYTSLVVVSAIWWGAGRVQRQLGERAGAEGSTL